MKFIKLGNKFKEELKLKGGTVAPQTVIEISGVSDPSAAKKTKAVLEKYAAPKFVLEGLPLDNIPLDHAPLAILGQHHFQPIAVDEWVSEPKHSPALDLLLGNHVEFSQDISIADALKALSKHGIVFKEVETDYNVMAQATEVRLTTLMPKHASEEVYSFFKTGGK